MIREPLRWETPLGRWVCDLTARGVAAELRAAGMPVTESAVYKWVAGSHAPRPDVALELVRISGEHLTLRDVYAPRFEPQLERHVEFARAAGA